MVKTVSGSPITTCATISAAKVNYTGSPLPSYYDYLYTSSVVYNHSSPNGGEINNRGMNAGEQFVLSYIASIVGASSCTWYNFFGIASLKVGVTLLTSTTRLYVDVPNPTTAQATDALSASTSSETPTRTRDGGKITVTPAPTATLSQPAQTNIPPPPVTSGDTINSAMQKEPPKQTLTSVTLQQVSGLAVKPSIVTISTAAGLAGVILSILQQHTDSVASPYGAVAASLVPLEYITIAGSTFAVSEKHSPSGSPIGNSVVIAGQTLTQGGNIVVAGQTISLAPGGQGVVIGSSTEGFVTTMVPTASSGGALIESSGISLGIVSQVVTTVGSDGKTSVLTVAGGQTSGAAVKPVQSTGSGMRLTANVPCLIFALLVIFLA